MDGTLKYFDNDLMDGAEDFHSSCYVNGSHVTTIVNTRYFCSNAIPTLTQLKVSELIEMSYDNSNNPVYRYYHDWNIEKEENVGDSLVPYWSATAGLPLSNSSVKTFGNKYHMNFVKHEDIIEEITTCILS